MIRAVARGVGGLVLGHPKAVALCIVLLTALSVWRVSKLEINNNQIDLLPDKLVSVSSSKEMIRYVGGVGQLIIAFKAKEKEHVKGVVEDLAAQIEQLPEVRKVVYKQDIGFIRERLPLYVATEDLEEGYQRIRKKVKEVLRKNNPFHISLREHEDEPLVLDDLIDKYRIVSKKRVDDDFYLDPAGEMVQMLVKPMQDSTDLDFTRQTMAKIEDLIARYNASNTRNAKVVEHYKGFAPDATVSYGYTGVYKTNLDDSDNIRAALVPTSIVSFGGILIYLLLTLRRPSQIAIIMTMLVTSILWTFAFCEVAIGELNTVTAILGAILMGMGIDFGIHFMYRFREEYTEDQDLARAILHTVEHSGSASAASAITTAIALYLLALSDFRGFSDFGLVAGTGVILTAILMYVGTPVVYVLLDRVAPRLKESLRVPRAESSASVTAKPYPFAKGILVATLLISAVLGYGATRITFDYDSGSLMSSDRPSRLLQQELIDRYGITSDPVGYYTETLEEARALYEKFRKPPAGSMVEGVMSIFNFVPDMAQQEANIKILEKLKANLEPITPDMLEEEQRKHWDTLQRLLAVQPFTMDDIPSAVVDNFRPVPESGKKGWLTFVFPKNSLWDGKELLRFNEEVGTVQLGEKTYHAAGMASIFADLARIVLSDVEKFTIVSAFAVLVVLIVNFQSLTAALLAMLPLLAGIVWMLGLMAFTNWRINFMNIVVFPVVVGYGISSGIHIFHRYRESGSALLAVTRTGAAVAASSITTLIGWAALLVSGHRGLESMAILACFGVASAFAVSVTVLPALLQVWPSRSLIAATANKPSAVGDTP